MDYSKSKIYKIVSENSDLCYIGSTTSTLTKRLSSHVAKSNHCKSKEIINLGNYRIVLIEKFPCQDKDELIKREQFHIDQTPNCINSYKAYTGIKYANKADYDFQYNKKFKNEIAEKRNVVEKCECNATYTKRNKARHLKSTHHINYIESKK